MTVEKFAIESVAIIGAGPAGVVTLNEFLKTTKDGKSVVGKTKENLTPEKRSFKKIVAFEQKNDVGGVWNTSVDRADLLPEEIIKGQDYYKPDVIQAKVAIPDDLSSENTVESPLLTPAADNESQWRRSAVYPGLYTNVPEQFLRFSSVAYKPKPNSENKTLDPLITYQQVSKVLTDFATDNDLRKYIRFNTQVEHVTKDEDGKYSLTLRRTNEDGNDEWYIERFDAVVVSSGHYSVPYIPRIPGLETRSSDSISHSKSFRDAQDFKDQDVLVVGSSLSGIDIIQYIYPLVKSLTISRTPGKQEIFPWLSKAAEQFENKPRITGIHDRTVSFQDGTTKDFDKIIFATGYHWHYPFLAKKFIELSGEVPTSGSRVKGLYKDVFTINDPTLAFVGVTLTSVKFHTLEVAASVIAGIWSNAKQLPPVEEQLQWEQERLAKTADNYLFHYYPFDVVKEQWVADVIDFIPYERKDPLEGEDIKVYYKALEAAERVFHDLKDQKVKFEETIWNGE